MMSGPDKKAAPDAEGARLDGWLRLVDAALPVMLWETDLALRVTASSGRHLVHFLQRGRDVVGTSLEDLLGSGAQVDLIIGMHRRALAGEAVGFDWRWDGRSYRCNVGPARDPDGRIVGVLGVAIDETEREEARVRAVESERHFVKAQAVAHVGSWERDVDTDTAIWSDELYRIFGLVPADRPMRRAAISQSWHPDDFARVKEAFARVTSRPGPVELDTRIVRGDGAVRVLHLYMEMFGPEGGRGRRVIGAAQDVTEQRAAEQELKSTLSVLKATLEATADGLLVVDLAGKIVRYNAKFAAMWQIPEEIISTNDDARALAHVLERVVDPAAFLARVRELYADTEREGYDEIHLKDGRIVERYSHPERLDGDPVGRVWSFRDVTAQRKAEAARDCLLTSERAAREAAQAAARRTSLLAEASRLLASLDLESALASLADLTTEWFADCCVVDLVSPEGSTRRAAMARSCARVDVPLCKPPEVATTVSERPGQAVLGIPLAIEGRVLGAMRFTREASQGFCAPDLALAEDLGGRASMAIEIARLYRRTEEALRARDEFLSVASHELRTPLATLQAATEGLLAGAYGVASNRPDSGFDKALHIIERQVRRLARLTNDVLDAIAVSTTGIDLNLAEEDLSAIAEGALEQLHVDFGRAVDDISLVTPGPVLARCDRSRIERLIASLVANAIRHGAGKPIEVSVDRRGDMARITVRDRGAGIAPERLPTLFDRFERAGASRSLGGLGLGLYIDRAIAVRHGGSIRVESKVGDGTTFFVEIPLAGPPGAK